MGSYTGVTIKLEVVEGSFASLETSMRPHLGTCTCRLNFVFTGLIWNDDFTGIRAVRPYITFREMERTFRVKITFNSLHSLGSQKL